ncbi:xanthine dehydrogenase molybdopterin binding subunit [Rhodobaculum claviforme]|uniref:Xanthine dehydrogenase molybdopterin binding subunit n=1 Tax=Rhodobaculum claviforme TaxID=1549854 RepID=A0A934TNC5_9RHOB|nr:xanthine dehydrogenase molybdopterin binding subunit [Rhodobaculum claviforme]
MPDVSPAAHDEPLLADGTVHHVGQPVFVVAADSHLAARRAVRLARLEIAEAPAILTLDDALAAGSRFEGAPRVWTCGDASAAIAAAPHLVEGAIEIGGQEHFYLEGQAALALPQEGGEMVIHASSQHPTEIQHKVAEALGLPMAAVRVEVRRMGGGFGGKESQGNALAVACAVIARITGRPVRMRYDRDDDFAITGKRHDFRIRYRAGVDAQGRILGAEVTHHARCGWSADLSAPVCDRAMLHATNAYHIPAFRVESHRLRTNTQSNTAFRGFGGPQGMLGAERMMDHIAHRLGLDPLAVRRVNFHAAPTAPALRRTTFYGMEVQDFVLHDLVDRLAETSRLAARRAEIDAWNRDSPVLKRGLALAPVQFGISFTLTHLNQAGALVHVYQDGSIAMNHGGTEMGQGLFQKVAQVAAEAFGVGIEAVRITATDTAKVPNTSATAASSGSDLNGMAVLAACEEIRGRMAAFVAAEHQTDPARVVFADGHVHAGGAAYPFAEVARRAWMARISLSATGFYRTPDIHWDRIAGRGRPFYYFAYGAAVAEVVIDTLTGENRCLAAHILHDCGASLNPALDMGQIEGGFVQGMGWLTTEELVWDSAGRLRTHAPSTYKIPACADRPRVFEVDLWEGANALPTIRRSKAVGEPPLMLANAVFLALSDAVAACGDGTVYPALDAPATPERVLAAVARQR